MNQRFRKDFVLNLLRITVNSTEGNVKDVMNQKANGNCKDKKES
jgi:hypothetical protein